METAAVSSYLDDFSPGSGFRSKTSRLVADSRSNAESEW